MYVHGVQANAQESSTVKSFTSFSSTLAGMIREAHRGVEECLKAESSSPALAHNLKCLALLVVNVPYGRLQPGHLGRVVRRFSAWPVSLAPYSVTWILCHAKCMAQYPCWYIDPAAWIFGTNRTPSILNECVTQ